LVAWIYLERLSSVTKDRFRLCPQNWKFALFICLMIASKMWDDLSMINSDFATIFSNLDLHRINELELTVLKIFNFSASVTNDEYYNQLESLLNFYQGKRIIKGKEVSELFSFFSFLFLIFSPLILQHQNIPQASVSPSSELSLSCVSTLSLSLYPPPHRCSRKRSRSEADIRGDSSLPLVPPSTRHIAMCQW
jgi:hypothetical protein